VFEAFSRLLIEYSKVEASKPEPSPEKPASETRAIETHSRPGEGDPGLASQLLAITSKLVEAGNIVEGIKRILTPYLEDPEVVERHARILANSIGSRDFDGKFHITRLAITSSLMSRGVKDPVLIEREVERVKRSILELASRIQVKPVPEVSINVSVSHISEREELYYQIVEAILEKRIIKTFYITSSNSQYELGIYCFNGLVYEPCEEELKALIGEMTKIDKDISKKTTRWVINEALSKIRISTLTPLRYEPLEVAFTNGIFNWENYLSTGDLELSLEDPSPDKIVFHKIPHRLAVERVKGLEGLSIEELAQRLCPKTLKAFKDWVGDKWILLFEIIGYTLYPRYDFNKAIMLVGEGRNGKSTYLRLIKKILGSQNVASIPLQDLVENRFAGAELYHKLANIYADLPDRPLSQTGPFKILTGEDYACWDRKFRDRICFTNYAKLLFSTNELPPVNDQTLAFWRRWLVIEFPNSFPDNPGFFEETFTNEEVEGAIIVSLIAFREVWKRRKFSFEESEADYKEKWLRETNSVYAFIKDLLDGKLVESLGVKAEKDPESRVEASKLYEYYVKYCENEDRTPVAKKIFTEELGKLGFHRVLITGRPFYKGLRLIEVVEEGSGLLHYG